MLHIPADSTSLFNIIGLDPGSNHFGISVITVNMQTMKIVCSDAWTINGEKLAGKSNFIEEIHGGRVNRILAIEDNLLEVFNYYRPTLVASEAPFINNAFPQAGIALSEVLVTIRRAVMRYDAWKMLYLIPPSLVKNAVGAGGAGKKDIIKEKVLAIEELNYQGFVPMISLDEHSIDALAVAYARYKSLI